MEKEATTSKQWSHGRKKWIFDKAYRAGFYLKADGRYANQEWIGAYYLKSGGYMAKSEWIYDALTKHILPNGHYVSRLTR